MAIALWIVQILLGLIFVMTGSFKLFQSREKVIASGGTWAEDFAPGIIKRIAGLELVSGIVVLAALISGHGRHFALLGLANIAAIMIGSIYVHIRRKEYLHAAINLVFLLMAAFVIYGGWMIR